MKKNLGITDRIIRFVIVDLLLGFSFLGIDIPPNCSLIAFILSISLVFTIVTGYSLVYQIFGISTRNEKQPDNSEEQN